MKKQNFILITHILLQFILFIPLASFIRYQYSLDIGIVIVFLLSVINFLAYIICVLNTEKNYILMHSLVVELFIIFIFLQDGILRNLSIGKYIELFLYSLILFASFNLLNSLSRIKLIPLITTMGITISIIMMKFNTYLASSIFDYIVIILLLTPIIFYSNDKNIRKYESKTIITLQTLFIIAFFLYKKYEAEGLVSISEYQLFTCIFIESILLYRISKTKIKSGLLFLSCSLKKIFPEFIILSLMLYFILLSFSGVILFSLSFFMFLVEFSLFEKHRKSNYITFEEMLDNYYVEKHRNLEIDKLNTLKIQTFLHDDILQIIIAIRRWIEDNLSGSGKKYIIENLDKLNDLIRHEINSFNPMLNDYSSLYDAYSRLIVDIENMYLDNEMLIEFECDRNIDLPSPYAELIYKCINELLINALKHSKGYSTDIVLIILEDKIHLTIKNYGDYLEDEEKIVEGNIGLNILRLNLREYGGKFDFNFFNNQNELDESFVEFKIEIPVERSVVNENLINRRS
ncbi:hypothetical protein [Anaerococcus tetradius]|uniref:ATPase/histidine kinase/DNA gyrase B/HSP90 domain protein n=1 Tax=Anaerococcus tetradius ATCC 35098 TaxID=525255 RepID=C2CH72_9FIRM|nr:hypothetical protein [Anaerococcus tetradius]EEI83138.1 hypothetical protein HMPREF0077_0832 [Anaerococcus tetradius ATCC 35098]